MFYTVDQYGVRFSDDKSELITAPQNLSGTYTIPETVSKLHYAAFRNCNALESVILPESLIEIPDNAFEYCKKLKKVEITSNINSIGRQSFACCDSLTEINLPTSLLSIGFQAFVECTSLEKIAIPDCCKCSERVFEGCKNLAQIEIPNSWTEIPEAIFRNCKSLEDITIPNGIIKISDSSFENCSSLYNIYIPDSVENIGKRVFAECKSLSRIRIGLNLKYIDKDCFLNCLNLENVFWDAESGNVSSKTFCKAWEQSITNGAYIKHFHIGAHVKVLPSFLCSELPHLEEIIIPNNVEKIGEGAFFHCNPRYLYLGKNVTPENIESFFSDTHSMEVYDTIREHNMFGSCYRLEKIEVSTQNPYFSSKNGNLYNKSGSTLIKFCAPRVWKTRKGTYQSDGNPISLVLDVEHIADFACYRLNIGKLVIENCNDVGKFAFYGCANLKSVSFGKVENQKERNSYSSNIVNLSFDNMCHNDLPQEKLSDTSYKLSIGTFAFGGCPNLTSVYWNITDGDFRIAESYQIWGRYGGSPITSREKEEYDFSQQIKKLQIGPCVSTLPPFMSKLLAVEELTIPLSVKDIAGGLPPKLKKMDIDTNGTNSEQNFIYDNGIILSKDGRVFIRYIGDANELIIPEGVVEIADSALSHSSVKRVVCPMTLESIGAYAFAGSKLESFVSTENLYTIGTEAFKNCFNLVDLRLNASLKEIGSKAFENCKLLPLISIQQGTKIKFDIIRGCSSMKELEINIESLDLEGLDGLQSIIWNCKGEKSTTYHNETDNTTFVKYERFDFGDGDVSYRYRIEESVAHRIQQLTFTENVECIPDYFADYMQIEEVDIPKNVKSIGHKAFWNCPKLKRIVIHSMDIECEIDFCHFDKLSLYVAKKHIDCVETKIIFNDEDVTDLFKKKNQKLHSDINAEI